MAASASILGVTFFPCEIFDFEAVATVEAVDFDFAECAGELGAGLPGGGINPLEE